MLAKCLQKLFFFYCNKPYSRSVIVRHFYDAYPNYLVEDREEKLMTFHSLRHFANTYFISNYIPETKVNYRHPKGCQLLFFAS